MSHPRFGYEKHPSALSASGGSSRCDQDPDWQPRFVGAFTSLQAGETVLPGKDVGVTSHLTQRVWQHEGDLVEGFTQRYIVYTLVWYEGHDTMESPIAREKTIKDGNGLGRWR